MPNLPLLNYAQARRDAQFERLKLRAASGLHGAVAARQAMKTIRAEQLRDEMREGRA